MMILDPISIATGGYIGIGPGAGDYCPLPLAIASDGYIRFTPEEVDPFGGGMGHGAVIWEPRQLALPLGMEEDAQLALLAKLAIDEMYGD